MFKVKKTIFCRLLWVYETQSKHVLFRAAWSMSSILFSVNSYVLCDRTACTNIDLVCFDRSFERSTPIFFERIITTSEGSSDFFESRRNVNNAANNYCIPSVIQMSAGLTERNLEPHVDFFAKRLKGLPSRLPSIYSVYRYFAFEVISN